MYLHLKSGLTIYFLLVIIYYEESSPWPGTCPQSSIHPCVEVWRCVVCDVMLMAGGRGTVEEEVSWWQRRDTSAAILVSNYYILCLK